MTRNDVIAMLVADLQPVRAQDLRTPFAWLSLICAAELVGFIAMGPVRQDFGQALQVPMFWWKCVACGVIAASSFVFAIRAVRPEHIVAASRRIVPMLVVLALGAGALLYRVADPLAHLPAWQWSQGASCLAKMTLLSMPVAGCLAFVLRRGAPTDIAGTSWICGLAAGSWGALVYTLQCRHDEAAFVLFWYVLGVAAITAAVRALLPAFIRW